MYTFNIVMDLRDILADPRDQGERGTCVAFAVTTCHEQHRNTDTYLSEEFLYCCCKTIDRNNEDGTRFDSAFVALENWGQAQGTLLPYNAKQNPILPISFDKKVIDDASQRKVKGIKSSENLLTAFEQIIKAEGSIAIGVQIYECFFTPIKGYIDTPGMEKPMGGHAILLVGYGIRSDHKKYFIIRNSWGKDWGDEGYAYLSYEYVEKYMIGNAWYISRRNAS